jgi:hypothetical protein
MDLATRPPTASTMSQPSIPSPVATAVAAARVKPPENTARRSKTTRSVSDSNP